MDFDMISFFDIASEDGREKQLIHRIISIRIQTKLIQKAESRIESAVNLSNEQKNDKNHVEEKE